MRRLLGNLCGPLAVLGVMGLGTPATVRGQSGPPGIRAVYALPEGVTGEGPGTITLPYMVVPTGPFSSPGVPVGEPLPVGDGAPCGGPADPWANFPPVEKFPQIGNAFIPPGGPGYYSLLDVLRGEYREAPPKYGYPRYGIIQFSYFNANWRYLDDPENTDTDFFDFLKRRHIGDNWLVTTGGGFRVRYNDERNSRLTGIDNNYYLTRTRVYGDLAFRDRFRIYGEFIGANSFDQNLPPLIIDRNFGDILNLFFDLRLFQLGGHPVYLRGGRQELLYGAQRLISPLDWANTRRTFQGGKLFWQGDKWNVDLFVVQPVVPNPSQLDSVDNDQVFTGLWTTYRPADGHTFDWYYLNLDQARGVARGRGGQPGAFNVSTAGARYVGTKDNWLWDLEGMLQFGGYSNQGLFAQAATTGLGYHFKNGPMTPTVWFYYDYASGDPQPGVGNVRRTFTQLFPFGHYYFGFIDVVGRQNIHDLNAHLWFYPTRWVTAGAEFHSFYLDSPRDALYNAAGVPIRRDPTGLSGISVGNEIDLILNFHLTKHQDIFCTYSHLFAGSFLKNTGNGDDASYVYMQYSYRW
jgi:hypothetical protein